MKHQFTASNIKYLETARGVAFTASLLHNGVKVGTIENEGNGGDTRARLTTYAARPEIDKAVKAGGFAHEENFLDNLLDIAEGVTR